MFKDERFINAGENEFYRWGRKAMEKAKKRLEPNKNGFYTIPCDGGKYWTIGTSEGKYGEFCKIGNECLSVNSWGYAWAKVGSKKEKVFFDLVNTLIHSMERKREMLTWEMEMKMEEDDEDQNN